MKTASTKKWTVLEKAVEVDDRAAVLAAIAKLSDHDKDLLVDCPVKFCPALVRQECTDAGDGKVHFGRRIMRLLKGIR